MRCLFTFFMACVISGTTAVLTLATAADEPLRRVAVDLAANATPDQVRKRLEPLGFVASKERQPAGASRVLQGQLPQKAVGEAGAVPGVARLVVGPVVTPPPPPVTSYTVQLRFRIDADRQQRFLLYKELLKNLQAAGFKKSEGLPGEEFYSDLIKRLTGTIAAADVDKLLRVPRVQSVLLIPDGYELPADAEQPVLADLGLTTWFGSPRQPGVAEKARGLLQPVGFQEAVGYHDAGHTRLLGWLPRGQVENLLNDEMQVALAVEPSPALAGAVEPALYRTPAFRRVEVLREPPGGGPAKEPPPTEPLPKEQAVLEKVSADLRLYLAGLQGDEQQKPVRVEVILRYSPPDVDRAWRDLLTAPDVGLVVEGRVGPLVTGWVPPAQVPTLAALAEVSTVRLPQPARALVLPSLDPKSPARLPVDFVSLSSPGANGVRGRQAQQVGVIASDFRGYQNFVGKGLPAKTHLVDFTAERLFDPVTREPNHAFLPAPSTGDSGEVGPGTRVALALMDKAPADELYLLRIDPAAPYQLLQIVRGVAGELWRSDALVRHENDLRLQRAQLENERAELRIERRIVFGTYLADEESRKAREEYRQRLRAFETAEQAHAAKVSRYTRLTEATRRLQDLAAVVLALRWTDGHPSLAGERTSLRYLEQARAGEPWPANTAWFQVVPRTSGQVWTGPFRDADQDGVMEFAPAGRPSTANPEVRYLAWKPRPWLANAGANRPGEGGDIVWEELPGNAVVQLTLQWREVHAPNWGQTPEDPYRAPLAPLQLVALRQRDPSGRHLPADVFEVVERSSGLPDRVENHPRYAIYQVTLRFRVPEQPGRYAVRLEGRHPGTTLPPQAGKLPHEGRWELQPKLTVEVVDPASRAQGQAVFSDLTK
jgi:hypothetical protein